ncbi:unnamed protein product [[Candida] boidinii]|nr:unnamed protein product [[Candida] boidinii]
MIYGFLEFPCGICKTGVVYEDEDEDEDEDVVSCVLVVVVVPLVVKLGILPAPVVVFVSRVVPVKLDVSSDVVSEVVLEVAVANFGNAMIDNRY